MQANFWISAWEGWWNRSFLHANMTLYLGHFLIQSDQTHMLPSSHRKYEQISLKNHHIRLKHQEFNTRPRFQRQHSANYPNGRWESEHPRRGSGESPQWALSPHILWLAILDFAAFSWGEGGTRWGTAVSNSSWTWSISTKRHFTLNPKAKFCLELPPLSKHTHTHKPLLPTWPASLSFWASNAACMHLMHTLYERARSLECCLFCRLKTR